jgi:hypothetical protein
MAALPPGGTIGIAFRVPARARRLGVPATPVSSAGVDPVERAVDLRFLARARVTGPGGAEITGSAG